MATLQEKQAPIDKELSDALIMATPDTWNSAVMEVERLQVGDKESFRITITSPEGHSDLISATDEIYSGLFKLSDVFRKFGNVWTRVKYKVELTPDGSWKYTADFQY